MSQWKPVYIIADIGINHNGDMEIVRNLINRASSIGCDAVKFQKRTLDIVYSEEMLASPRESPWGNTQRAQKEGLELGQTEYKEIDTLCRELGIDWSASAWDLNSLKFIRQFDVKFNKVASAMTTDQSIVTKRSDLSSRASI